MSRFVRLCVCLSCCRVGLTFGVAQMHHLMNASSTDITEDVDVEEGGANRD